jgi:hypothetical protein
MQALQRDFTICKQEVQKISNCINKKDIKLHQQSRKKLLLGIEHYDVIRNRELFLAVYE